MDKNTQSALDNFRKNVIKNFNGNIDSVILFGSYARGDYTEDSDVDILVVARKHDPVMAKNIIGMAFDQFLKSRIYLSVKIFDRKGVERYRKLKTEFISNVMSEGIVLYGKGIGAKSKEKIGKSREEA